MLPVNRVISESDCWKRGYAARRCQRTGAADRTRTDALDELVKQAERAMSAWLASRERNLSQRLKLAEIVTIAKIEPAV